MLMKMIEFFAVVKVLIVARLAKGQPVVSVQAGKTALLPCKLSFSGQEPAAYVIEWSRAGSTLPIFYKIANYPARADAEYKARTSLRYNSANLRIQNVKISDEGWYECKILYLRNENHEREDTNGTWIKLIVTARPSIISAPPPVFIGKVNETLLLRCNIQGHPKPYITWWKDGRLLTNGENGYRIIGGELLTNFLRTHHKGNYACRGQNSEGQVEYTTLVFVEAPPEIIVPPKNLTLKEGLDAYFICRAKGYPENITYSWHIKGKPISECTSLIRRYKLISDGTLTIYNVNRFDTGPVTCIASNECGNPVNASAFLTIQYRARVRQMPPTLYGGFSLNVELPCDAEGEPQVTFIRWRKNGEEIGEYDNERIEVSSVGNLLIKRMQAKDQGRYTCTPYNKIGTAGESSQLRLIGKPPPQFTVRPQSLLEAELRKPLKLFCNAKGDPLPLLSWKRVDSNLSELPNKRVYWNDGNLTITSVMKKDHGLWQCVATNPVTVLISNVNIFVKYTTPHVTTNVSVETTSEGATIRWIAGYDGGFPQHFMIWYKRVDQGDHAWLTSAVNGSRTEVAVNRLEPATVYQFSVLAENVLGSGKFSKTVTALTKDLPTESPVPKRSVIPPPQNLTFFINKQGAIMLSWKQPELNQIKNFLGYVLEYRVKHKRAITIKPQFNVTHKEAVRKNRSVKDNEEAVSGYLEQFGSSWDVLSTYTANVTSIKIDKDILYQDSVYEFHVLAVTFFVYSAPSNSVFVDTTGLTYYLPLVSAVSIKASVLSGIIAGAIFVVLFTAIVFAFCVCRFRDKSRVDNEILEQSERFLQNSKTKKSFLSRSFRINAPISHSDKPAKRIGPIYRSPDGKFHLYRLSGSMSKSNQTTSDLDKYQNSSLRTQSLNSVNLCSKVNKPISDSCQDNFENHLISKKFSSSGEKIENDQDEDDGPSLEIDCSHSNIKVRYVVSDRGTSRATSLLLSTVEHFPFRSKEPIYTDYSKQFFDSQIESCGLKSSVHRQFPVTPKPITPCYSASEYVYFNDLGIKQFENSKININDKQRSSPIYFESFPNSQYLHSSTKFPHKNFQRSSNGNLDNHNTLYPTFQNNFFPIRFEDTDHTINELPVIEERTTESITCPINNNETLRKATKKSQITENEGKQLNENSNDLNVVENNSNNLTAYKSFFNTNNNGSSHYRPPRRSYSCSMLTSPSKKATLHCDKFRIIDKEFVSLDEMQPRFDSISEKRFSFTSGSASTIRCAVMDDSNIMNNEELSHDSVIRDTTSKDMQKIASNQPETIHTFLSPPLPGSELGGESCSGYESQNTSSDTSSMSTKSKNLEAFRNFDKHTINFKKFNEKYKIELNGFHSVSTINEKNKCEITPINSKRSSQFSSSKISSWTDDCFGWDSKITSESVAESHENPAQKKLEAKTIEIISSINDPYSKEKMEERCEALKKEYFDYKRKIRKQQINNQINFFQKPKHL